ncbi:hypothetical protein [Streptomyces umbrinus]|uniref:hypothetical protein n=1 Tax=Streptomyces umbrinus TaxID=67370 RepID=UPI0033DABA05
MSRSCDRKRRLYPIDTLGLYLTRSGRLATWPVEEYLELLGACRRELPVFRTAFTELLEGCTADAEPYGQDEEDQVRRLLERLVSVAAPGHCPVCTGRCPESGGRRREFCSPWCRSRAQTLRNKGLLPGGPVLLFPRPRKQHLEMPEECEVVSWTARPSR